MAVAFKTALNTASNVANKPTGGGGIASGDLLVAFVMTQNSNGAITPPSGWTLIGSAVYDGATCKYAAYYLVAGSSEPSTYTWTIASNTYTEITIAAYTGADTSGTPINTSGISQTSSGNLSTPSMPSITTTVANCMLAALGNDFFGCDWSTHTPSGWTLDAGIGTGSASWDSGSFHKSAGTAGAYGGDTMSYGATSAPHGVILVAIAPPSSGGGGGATTSSTTPHAAWPNPQPSRVRGVALTRAHQERTGVAENDLQLPMLEEFFGDGTQQLNANQHGRWPDATLRITNRVSMTRKATSSKQAITTWPPDVGVNDNDLVSGVIDQFFGVIDQPGTQQPDSNVAPTATAALVESAGQVVSPSGDAAIATAALVETAGQVVSPSDPVIATAALVESSALVINPSAPVVATAVLSETSALIIEPSTPEVANAVLVESGALIIASGQVIQANALLSEAAQVVAQAQTVIANAAIASATQQVVDPSAPIVANALLNATGGIAGQGGGTLIANASLVETAAQLLSTALEVSNAAVVETAARILAGAIVQTTAILSVTGSVINPSGVVAGDVKVADSALMTVTIADQPALCTVTLADAALMTVALADSAP